MAFKCWMVRVNGYDFFGWRDRENHQLDLRVVENLNV